MKGHPQAVVVLFPCSLSQGFKEATMGITIYLFVCLFICLFVCLFVCLFFLAPRSVASGGSDANVLYLPGVWLQLG